MDFAELLRNPSAWTLIALLAYAIYKERGRIFGLFERRADASRERDKADLHFDELARQKVLRDGDYSHELMQFFLQIFETERMERRSVIREAMDQTGTTRHLADEAITVMKDFADIARRMVDHQDRRDVELLKIEETLRAVGFVLAKLYFRQQGQQRGYSDLVVEMEADDVQGGG